MKIYFPSIHISKINKDYIKKYLVKEEKKHFLLSCEGFILVQREKMYRIHTSEYPLINEKIDNFEIIINMNKWIKEEEWLQIYPDVIEEHIEVVTYQLRKGAIVEFIIERQKNKISDFYFLIKSNDDVEIPNINNNISIKEDIISFLSELNLC
jgi:hypothetical protein